jgi:type I restriction enzyme M protein
MGAEDQQLELLGALEALGRSAGNGRLRDLLGWDEATYEAVKAPLVASGQLRTGRGRGGSVALADDSADIRDGDGEDSAVEEATDERPRSHSVSKRTNQAMTAPAPGPQPTGKQNLSAFLWSIADLLRGDYKRSDYGKVILPFTVLRRLDCVLEPTKEAVLA